MKKVRCINNGYSCFLKNGEVYKVSSEYPDHYILEETIGEWNKSRFEIVEEDETRGDMIQSALDRQEGGSHYKKLGIQPVEYAMKNNLNYCQANVIKYTTRYKDKGGLEDLKKAIHNIELLIEMEYGGKND